MSFLQLFKIIEIFPDVFSVMNWNWELVVSLVEWIIVLIIHVQFQLDPIASKRLHFGYSVSFFQLFSPMRFVTDLIVADYWSQQCADSNVYSHICGKNRRAEKKKTKKKSSFWERRKLNGNSIVKSLVNLSLFFPCSPRWVDSRLVTLIVGSRCPRALRADFRNLKIGHISAPRFVPHVILGALRSKFSALDKCQNRRVGKNSSKNSRQKNVLISYSNQKWPYFSCQIFADTPVDTGVCNAIRGF